MIDIQQISFAYGRRTAPVFEDFSLTLKEGNIYGLLGKNGTGKSTLLYLLSGLLRPSKGVVFTEGMVASERRPEMLQEVMMVPEEFDLPKTTMADYVRANAPFYPRFDHAALAECLNDFGLSMTDNLGSLSMGNRKKAYISFALAAGTKWLLMDEPTNGLDIPSKNEFRRVVARSMSADRAIVISTHQVRDVETLLDHVVIIDQTSLLLDCPLAELTEKWSFELRPSSAPLNDALYAMPSLQGNLAIAPRCLPDGTKKAETPVMLELLFNAAIEGRFCSQA